MNERNRKRAVEMTGPHSPGDDREGKWNPKPSSWRARDGRKQLESARWAREAGECAMGARGWRVRDGREQLESARWAREAINGNGT